MKVDGQSRRTIWAAPMGDVSIIDQVRLPHRFEIATLADVMDAARAIRDMHVRGAPLIGVTAAYGVALAMRADPSDANLEAACSALRATRPTAINLAWALAEMRSALAPLPASVRAEAAYEKAAAIAEADVEMCRAMAEHGLGLIRALAAAGSGRPVEVLTHCNAGWLATVDWGTATAPIYAAYEARQSTSTSSSTRRARATRAPRSPPGSSAATACRTRSSSTTSAAISCSTERSIA